MSVDPGAETFIRQWCNEVFCVLSTISLCKLPSSSWTWMWTSLGQGSHFRHGKTHFWSLQAFCRSPSVCFWRTARLSQVSFLNSMFHLTNHTMRWWSIPEMLHLLLRSFPEFAGSESLISALYFSLESVVFSHKGCLLSWGCFVEVSKRFTNGHNSSRC